MCGSHKRARDWVIQKIRVGFLDLPRRVFCIAQFVIPVELLAECIHSGEPFVNFAFSCSVSPGLRRQQRARVPHHVCIRLHAIWSSTHRKERTLDLHYRLYAVLHDTAGLALIAPMPHLLWCVRVTSLSFNASISLLGPAPLSPLRLLGYSQRQDTSRCYVGKARPAVR